MPNGGCLVVIDFSKEGNSEYFRRDGWSDQEPGWVWGIGARSQLRIPIEAAGSPLVLEAEIAPAVFQDLITRQIVRVQINGIALGGVRLDGRSMIRCEIDPALLRADGILEIEFGFPGFFRPGFARLSPDDRPLSCSFYVVRVYTIDLIRFGPNFLAGAPETPVIDLLPPAPDFECSNSEALVYHFGEHGTAWAGMRSGWDNGEDKFTWTVASASRLDLPAPRTSGSYALRLEAWPLIVPHFVVKQDVTVVLNGVVIGQVRLHGPRPGPCHYQEN